MCTSVDGGWVRRLNSTQPDMLPEHLEPVALSHWIADPIRILLCRKPPSTFKRSSSREDWGQSVPAGPESWSSDFPPACGIIQTSLSPPSGEWGVHCLIRTKPQSLPSHSPRSLSSQAQPPRPARPPPADCVRTWLDSVPNLLGQYPVFGRPQRQEWGSSLTNVNEKWLKKDDSHKIGVNNDEWMR